MCDPIFAFFWKMEHGSMSRWWPSLTLHYVTIRRCWVTNEDVPTISFFASSSTPYFWQSFSYTSWSRCKIFTKSSSSTVIITASIVLFSLTSMDYKLSVYYLQCCLYYSWSRDQRWLHMFPSYWSSLIPIVHLPTSIVHLSTCRIQYQISHCQHKNIAGPFDLPAVPLIKPGW